MTILVTGGAGFIGSHLIQRLLARNLRVVCLDSFDDFYDPGIKHKNVSAFLTDRRFELVHADIRDEEGLSRLFRSHRFDAVVHLAARPGVRDSLAAPLLYLDVNVKGTIGLLRVCGEFQVARFIFGSSSAVYGANTQVPFAEGDGAGQLKPISPYGASKAAAEMFCYTYHQLYGMGVICLRLFTAYGPRQRPEMAIHRFTRLIDQGEVVTMYGDGSTCRDYTYIEDIIDGMEKALHYPAAFEVFNLGHSRRIELRYLISLIERNLGKGAKIRQAPVPAGEMSCTWADISKAGKLLGYKPAVSIEDGIELFIEWFRRGA